MYDERYDVDVGDGAAPDDGGGVGGGDIDDDDGRPT